MSASSCLQSLPSELLIQEIFARLPWPSVAACSRTCRLFYNILKSSPQLDYKRELYLAGMIDNPRNSDPLPTRLAMLRERETRWLHLDPKVKKAHSPPSDIAGHYELEGGVYTLAKKFEDTKRSVYTCRPSAIAENKDLSWTEINIGENIIDFGMAVEDHDLIVFATCVPQDDYNSRRILIRLVQHSTHLPHPLAAEPVLDTRASEVGEGDMFADVRVGGDHLIAVLRYPRLGLWTQPPRFKTMLYAWNWRTGQRASNDFQLQSTGGLFLRHDIFINANSVTPQPSLDVYYIPPSTTAGALKGPPICHVQRLYLPELRPDVTLVSMQCRADPNTCSPSELPTNLESNRPFSHDASRSLIIVMTDIQKGDGSWTSFTMLAHRHNLLERFFKTFTPNPQSPDIPSFPAEHVSWDDWGPGSTRWLEVDAWANPFVTCAAGSRWVRLKPEDPSRVEGPRFLQVFDFDPHRVKLARSQLKKDREIRTGHEATFQISHCASIKVVDTDHPTVLGSPFRHSITTRLPYIRSTYLVDDDDGIPTRKRDKLASWMNVKLNISVKPTPQRRPLDWHGVMIDERFILGTKASEEGTFRPAEIEVLYFG